MFVFLKANYDLWDMNLIAEAVNGYDANNSGIRNEEGGDESE